MGVATLPGVRAGEATSPPRTPESTSDWERLIASTRLKSRGHPAGSIDTPDFRLDEATDFVKETHHSGPCPAFFANPVQGKMTTTSIARDHFRRPRCDDGEATARPRLYGPAGSRSPARIAEEQGSSANARVYE